MNIGTIIRRNRKSRKLTLKVVAERAGISEGFLSQIENNVNLASVNTLMKICSVLGVKAGDVIKEAEKQEKLVLIKKSEWDDADMPRSGFITRRFLPPDSRSVIDSALIVLQPDRMIPVRKDVRNSQEVLCVLRGTVELSHGEQTVTLTSGDTAHYLTDPDKQMITNRGKEPAVILWVGTI
jgi:transcriptional regulator with XRE-family HTH domain